MDCLNVREDTDSLLSFYTKQQVNILDRYLGITNIVLQLLIVFYVVGYVFINQKGYLEYEMAKGATAVHVRGDCASVSSGKPGSRYFSAEEITYPGLENGNVFVATRASVMNQKRGVCEDKLMPCRNDDDCSQYVEGKCIEETSLCKEPSWCDLEEKGYIFELDTSDFQVWVKSSVQFIQIANDQVYTTATDKPEHLFNTFSVRELLMMCDPPVRYEEVSELGAAIEVQFVWSCNVASSGCTPTVQARRLDTLFDPANIGFGFLFAEYESDDVRHLNEMKGIRIFIRTVGTGRVVSLSAISLKASTGIVLLGLAPIIADLLMLKVFKLSKKYEARKYEISPDFSEYMEKLQAAKEEKGEEDAENDDNDREAQEREEEWQRKLDEED
eukprot:gnl/TRDRNA2_/TRDRNA2_187713_c0_seq1.p1 gnl/TRDRNA2_/TRDRNA2_187713_c0~~gnl/TRDRNA2_/TRDRNA2_187713_c0_seq1.p1  ORF type:complete len:386 (+),score=90.36 gnl/TRDRNA2_/TRDRNA2_187713_c0_seq1:87-1244(+)